MCDSNQIDAVIESSVSNQGELALEIYKDSYTSTNGLLDILFSNFAVSVSECFMTLYSLSQSDSTFELYTEINAPEITEEGFTLTIDTTQVRDYVFSIYGENDYENSELSSLVTISVVEEVLEEVTDTL
jgi:hypothetical protein